MDGKILARLGAVVFVALAITATVIDMTRKEPAPIDTSVPTAAAAAVDPLGAELIHCQLLGEAAESDPACLRAWAENRRRFLTPATSEAR
jgi:conjugative transfer region protein TrbK